MNELQISLRRSPRMLLERDGHPGPGPGRLALVMARAGVGKTAFLVGIGVDALLAHQRVLHVSLDRSVDRIRDWYDDLLLEMLRREDKVEQRAAVQLEMERRRHIHTYVDRAFSVERLRSGIELLRDVMQFSPEVIIIDRARLDDVEEATIAELRRLAEDVGAELWMACRTHRDGPQGEPGRLPPPADRFDHLVDLAFRLDPHDSKIRLHVVKSREGMVDQDLNVVLDPRTLLLTTGVGARR